MLDLYYCFMQTMWAEQILDLRSKDFGFCRLAVGETCGSIKNNSLWYYFSNIGQVS